MDRGFTLIELLISTVVAVTGLVAIALLIGYGTQMQVSSRDTNMASALAREKMEQLRIVDPSDPQRALGGDLSSNVANHFDTVSSTSGTTFTRRWTVALDPSGKQDVTVAVIQSGQGRTIQFRTLLPDG